MGCCLTTRVSQHIIPTPDLDSPETLGPEAAPPDVPSLSGPSTNADGGQEIVITSIQATDLTLGLGRIPAGFFAVVYHSGLEWRTERKPVLVNRDVVEWSGPIPIQSDPRASVSLAVQAAFEFQPVLGSGEQLRMLTVTVEQLLDHSAKELPFTFPDDSQDRSPCSSLLVVVGRQGNNTPASDVLAPHCPSTDLQGRLEEATDQGHRNLTRYRKNGEERDLEHAIERFQHALNICPLDHPCYVVARSNLAKAELINRLAHEIGDTPLDGLLTLYRSVLVARPVGHPDRASTLIQLAVALFKRFDKLQDEANATDAEALLREAIDLSSTESHEYQAAASVLRSRNGPAMRALQAGALLLDRFEESNDLAFLQQAISVLEGSVTSGSLGGEQCVMGLSTLGTALYHRFDHLGELGDLEEAISRQQEAANLCPDDHSDKPALLTNFGAAILKRFECTGRSSDLEHAISAQRDALHFTPDGHPHKATLLNNLGKALVSRFECLGELSDLEDAISRQRDAIHLTPDHYPHKVTFLSNLGSSLKTRFRRLGDLLDLQEAISSQRNAVNRTPDDSPHKSDFLDNLGNSLVTRFERLGESGDLEDAILMQRNSIHLTPDGHPRRPGSLNSLSNSLVTRFKRFGQLSDLEEASSMQRDAVRLTPDDHPRKPTLLNNLGNLSIIRFKHFGELSDLECAISTQQDVVRLTPDGHPEKPSHLNSLAISFFMRFERLGKLSDLEEAISREENVVEMTPDNHPRKPGFLNNLTNSLITRHEHLGHLGDLEEAILKQRDAVHLTPDGCSDKPNFLSSLGIFLFLRFQRLGRPSDLEEAISIQRKAAGCIPDGHPDKPGSLSDLGSSLTARFKRIGQLTDLKEAILMQQDAVRLTPNVHIRKPIFLNNLGNSLIARFERCGELSDLEDAISKRRDAVHLTPDGHSRKPLLLTNLGNSMRIRFMRFGELSDLEQAISSQRDAVKSTPDDHPHKLLGLNSLSNSLVVRFQQLKELGDLEEAISMLENAVNHIPDDHPDKPGSLNSLGYSLMIRFKHLGQLTDLEETISRRWDAFHLVPDGHPDKVSLLSNIGISLFSRFEVLGELRDLEGAILRQEDVVNLTPDGHPDKPAFLNNLGVSLRNRFKQCGELSDLEIAICKQRDAVGSIPDGHPNRFMFLDNLGASFLARFNHCKEIDDFKHIVSSYSYAAFAPTGPITYRFRGSLALISCSRFLGPQALLDAYSAAMLLLPQLAWTGLSLAHRYRELVKADDIARSAAAVALDSGQPETAVEWLEQGRSIVWGELFQLRSSCDELSSVYPDHARRLRKLSAALEHASVSREKIVFSQSEQSHGIDHRIMESLQEVADRHRALALDRDKLLQDIRKLPGFERFLLHKDFSQLRAAAHGGPVVILNAARTRCDALIVLADVDHVIHVPLPNFTHQRSVDLQTSLKSFVRHAHTIRDNDRDGRPAPQESTSQWQPILASLWKSVAKPVLDALALSTPGKLTRIFWCPTGPFTFLPIHAAGIYDKYHSQPGYKVHDFVVSSYVPTLSVLASLQLSSPGSDLRLLAVPQPLSDGLRRLPGVVTELDYIRLAIGHAPSVRITLIESSSGTVDEVLDLMKETDWVHFACHGVQDTENPTESGLCLADQRRLKLSDVISLSRPHGGLAFLSACQTAKGDEDLTDEAIHISAGMLFAGYGGVIGSMWSISDKHAPDVTKDVYEQLFLNGTHPDYREAARALHTAVGRLRDRNAPFEDWVPFIHVGF